MRKEFLEEEIGGFSFREYGELGRPRYLVLGLPDIGLVGSIGAMHVVRSLGMDDVMGIESYAFLPPVVVISSGEPKYPMRIYRKDDMAVLVTDVPVSPPGLAPLAMAIVEFARRRGIELIVSMTGLGSPKRLQGGGTSVYWIASDSEADKAAREADMGERLEEGILVGPYAIILKEAVRKMVSNIVIMAESYPEFPDPEAAAEAVRALSRLSNREIDVGKLLEEAELLKIRLKGLMKDTKETLAKMGKGYEYRPPLIYT